MRWEPARPTSLRTARAMPVARSWGRAHSSGAAPESTRRTAPRAPSKLDPRWFRLHGAQPPFAAAQQVQLPVVVLLDGGPVADADQHAVGQFRPHQLVERE